MKRKPKPTLTIDWKTETNPVCRVLGGIDSIEHVKYPGRKVERCPVRIWWAGSSWAAPRSRPWKVHTCPFSKHGGRYSKFRTADEAVAYAVRYFESNFRIKGD